MSRKVISSACRYCGQNIEPSFEGRPQDICKTCWGGIFCGRGLALASAQTTLHPREHPSPNFSFTRRVADLKLTAQSNCQWCNLFLPLVPLENEDMLIEMEISLFGSPYYMERENLNAPRLFIAAWQLLTGDRNSKSYRREQLFDIYPDRGTKYLSF